MKKRDEWEPREPLPMDDEPQADEPQSFLAMRRIELAGRLHHMAFRSVLQASGLPPAQAGALKTIVKNPGLSQRELGDHLHIQRATCTVMLQKMEKAGYIRREPDPFDQRISRIYPTEAAEALDENNEKAFNDYFDRCFSGFSQEEFDALQAALVKLNTTLRDMTKDIPEPPDKPHKE